MSRETALLVEWYGLVEGRWLVKTLLGGAGATELRFTPSGKPEVVFLDTGLVITHCKVVKLDSVRGVAEIVRVLSEAED